MKQSRFLDYHTHTSSVALSLNKPTGKSGWVYASFKKTQGAHRCTPGTLLLEYGTGHIKEEIGNLFQAGFLIGNLVQAGFLIWEWVGSTLTSVRWIPNFLFICKSQPAFIMLVFLIRVVLYWTRYTPCHAGFFVLCCFCWLFRWIIRIKYSIKCFFQPKLYYFQCIYPSGRNHALRKTAYLQNRTCVAASSTY